MGTKEASHLRKDDVYMVHSNHTAEQFADDKKGKPMKHYFNGLFQKINSTFHGMDDAKENWQPSDTIWVTADCRWELNHALMAFTVNKEETMEQEDIDDSLYEYGKYGPQPQSPSPTVSDASSIVFSICPSNDSDGELGAVSDHSVNDNPIHDHIPIPSIEQVTIATQKTQPQVPKPKQTVDCDYYEKKMEREAALKSKRVVHADVRQATPTWTNTNRVNKANQFTPRPVQLSNIRPNLSTASKTIKTCRVNVNTGHGNVSSVSSAGTQIKSGSFRFNTGKHNVNSGSVQVNTARVNRPDHPLKHMEHRGSKGSISGKVKRIFKYIKGKPKLGLWYPRESPLDLVAYSDSDYTAANLDRKSTTGGCQFLRRRLISWQYKKQTRVATSTTEAEYVAAASCCGQVLWLQNQLLDYGFNFMNTIIHIDNQSTICIIKNPVYHSTTKHIEIRQHFIRDCYEKKLIQVQKIHTNLNVADLLTKEFDGPRYYLELERMLQAQLGHEKGHASCHLLIGCRLVVSNDVVVNLLTNFERFKYFSPNLSMAQLKYCDKYNQVGFLFKPAESAGYTEIVDFLRRSKLRYALTHNPPIYDSLVKQFWQTATTRTLADGTQQLNATIDSIEYTITEESVRRQLQLADASGINMLQNEEIFAGLQNIGYVNDRTFTFWKSQFTPQWRFLIHHILHCISSKSGGWDQFGSNIATALICLSTGRDFNFSKLIFDGMISNLKSKSKFLMYPRFLQMILNIQTENKNLFVPVLLTKKIFGNMKRSFQGIHRPLLPAMLTIDAGQPQPSAAPTPSQPVPTPTPSHVQTPPPITSTPPPITQPPPLTQTEQSPPTLTQPVQSTTPPPQPSSVQLTSSPPPIQPVQPTPPITFSSPPITTIPDTQPTHPPSPQIPSPPHNETEGPSFEPSYHMSPPPSHEPEIQTSRTSEESEQLRNLLDLVPRLESRVESLEKELSDTKQTLGTTILQLIEKVKKLENKLRQKRKREETEDEEDAEGQDQEVPSQTDQGNEFATPEKSKDSGEAQADQISPSTLEAAQILTNVASEGFKGSQAPLGSKIYRRKPKSTPTPTKILDFEEPAESQVNTGSTPSAQVNTAEVNTAELNTGEINTAGEDKGQREGKAPMLSEETPKKSKEQILQEEASLAEAIRLDSLQKEEEAKQIHLDALLAQRIAEEEELTEQQKKRKAQVQFEAQHYTNEDWDLIRAKLEANAELSKSMLGSELQGEDFAKRMVDLEDEPTNKSGRRRKQMARKGMHTSVDRYDSEESDEIGEQEESNT
ncbi:hypothetical protein Tco_0630138, partial [Tanacetum coccineum]